MLFTRIRKNRYHDSINLTILTQAVNTTAGVNKAQVMLGTDANKELFQEAGLYNDDVKNAGANDMIVAIDATDEAVMDQVMKKVEDYLTSTTAVETADDLITAPNWKTALSTLPDANLVLIATSSLTAVNDIEQALEHNLHVFALSDDIPLEDEVRLKNKAHAKGLLLMGPSSQAGMISSVPIGLMESVRPGNIGIIGTSSSDIQKIVSNISRLGGGVIHALPTGERDLTEAVSAKTMITALVALENMETTDVLVVVAKQPSSKVRKKVMWILQNLSKPVVLIFSNENHQTPIGNVYQVANFDEAADLAVALAFGDDRAEGEQVPSQVSGEQNALPAVSSAVIEFLTTKPQVITIGTERFGNTIKEFGGKVVGIAEQKNS